MVPLDNVNVKRVAQPKYRRQLDSWKAERPKFKRWTKQTNSIKRRHSPNLSSSWCSRYPTRSRSRPSSCWVVPSFRVRGGTASMCSGWLCGRIGCLLYVLHRDVSVGLGHPKSSAPWQGIDVFWLKLKLSKTLVSVVGKNLDRSCAP